MLNMMVAAMLAATSPVAERPADAHFAAARDAMDKQLFDYTSARFRDVRGDGALICGFVNAKNRMGAYTGWSRFVWFKMGAEPARLLVDDGTAEGQADIFIDGFCGEDGRRLEGPDYSDRLTHR